jgi:hypothetical protein
MIRIFKIWFLKREIREIDTEIEEFYLKLLSRNDEFQENIDIDNLHKKFINLRNIEKRELYRQIDELKR